ncbi:hypothetical protein AB3X55_00120 [Alphaproteobacteria bacterium LSUCC0719]
MIKKYLTKMPWFNKIASLSARSNYALGGEVCEKIGDLIKENNKQETKRLKIAHASKTAKQLASSHLWKDVLIFCKWFHEQIGEFPKIFSYLGRAELECGSPKLAVAYLYEAVNTEDTKNNNMSLFQALKITGRWDEAIAIMAKMQDRFEQAPDVPIETSFSRLKGSAEFLRRADELFHSVNQPTQIKGVVFLSSYSCENTIGLNLLALNTLKKRGYAVIHLCEGILSKQATGDTTLDKFHGMLGYKKNFIRTIPKNSHRYYDWEIDWSNKIIKAQGINFYQCFFERLSRDYRKYSISYDIKTRSYIDSLINQADVALKVINEIRSSLGDRPNFPVRFLSGSSQYVPYGIFRTYCANLSGEIDFEFVSTLIGKEFNFYNKINANSHFVSTRNVTAYKDTRMPQLPTADGFSKWVKNHRISTEERNFVDRFISYDRNLTSKIHPKGQEVLDRIEKEKSLGRPIICVFGKVIWDFDYPYDSGPAHNSLKDWINHTVDCARNSEAIFLIKPHPHEEVEQIAGKPNERFIDLIECEIPSNVVILGTHWLNTRDLVDKIDLGVVWAGTVQLDLGINEVPVLTCCDWGAKDYPIDFMRPKNRSNYQYLLSNVEAVTPPKNYRENCIDVLRYMASDELFIPYSYYVRSTTNLLIIPSWIEHDIDNFNRNGDVFVEQQADRFFDDRPITLENSNGPS